MKNKTLATWLAFLGGILGLHRFYLWGKKDLIGWLLWIPTLLGFYGITRAQRFGVDDTWIWLLIPLLGFNIAGCALNALAYGLMDCEKWNRRFSPDRALDDLSGQSNWLTVAALVLALFFGTTALMASLAFTAQRYFEYQSEEATVSQLEVVLNAIMIERPSPSIRRHKHLCADAGDCLTQRLIRLAWPILQASHWLTNNRDNSVPFAIRPQSI